MSHFTKKQRSIAGHRTPPRWFVNKHVQKKHTTKASRHSQIFQTCPNKACWSSCSRDVAYITYEYLSSIFIWLLVLSILKNSQLGRIIPIMENKSHVPVTTNQMIFIIFPYDFRRRHRPGMARPCPAFSSDRSTAEKEMTSAPPCHAMTSVPGGGGRRIAGDGSRNSRRNGDCADCSCS